MGLEDLNKIDELGELDSGEIVLMIYDYLDWKNELEHLEMLQEKINNYIEFAISEQIEECFTDNDCMNIVIGIEFKEEIPENVEKLLKYFNEFLNDIEEKNIILDWDID